MNTRNEYWKQKILSAIGKPVHYKYPDGTAKNGILKDRVVAVDDEFEKEEWSPEYFNVIDLISFEDGEYIRFSYYHIINRRGKDVLKFAGQTSLTAPPEFMKNLFGVAREKPWFRELITPSYASP